MPSFGDELKKNLQDYLYPIGEKLLLEQREKSISTSSILSGLYSELNEKSNNLRYQIVAISAGTIAILTGFSKTNNTEVWTNIYLKFSVLFLCISVVTGIILIILNLHLDELRINFQQEAYLNKEKQGLDFLNKFYGVNTKTDEEFFALTKKSFDNIAKSYSIKAKFINNLLSKTHLDSEVIWYMQLFSFLVAFVLIAFGTVLL